MTDSTGPDTVITQYFPDPYKPKILNGNLSTVNGGWQTNNYYTNNYYKKKENVGNLPQLREFTEVKRGDILKVKDICEFLQTSFKGKGTTEATVYTAEIIPCGSRKFTVKAYNGRKAKKAWRQDFLRCSNDWSREIPLFGYSNSSVPLLIFHGELVPISHIEARAGWVEQLYFDLLSVSFGCARNELWMDPTKGNFCRGPAGPECLDSLDDGLGVDLLPSDTGFLKEDALIRYFSSTKHDLELTLALAYSHCYGTIKENIITSYHSRVVSSLTNYTIAFTQNVEWGSSKGCHDRSVLPNGMTRFLLRHDRRFVEIYSLNNSFPWLFQSLSVFHAHNIQLDEDLSVYKLVGPRFKLTGTLKESKHKQQRRRQSSPIFLFLLPSPFHTVQFYYWSHDPASGIPLSQAQCKYLGLPFKFLIKVFEDIDYWSTRVYKALHNYQISRSFDPKTMDFAQFLGFNTPFEIVPAEDRLKEVEEDNDICASPGPQSLPVALDCVSRCPEAESLVVPEFLDGNCSEQSDDVYSLDELFKDIEIKGPAGPAHIKFASLINWPFTHRGMKPSVFTITAQDQDLKQSDREQWLDVD